MHHPYTITIISIEEVLNPIDGAQTVIIVAPERDWQVQGDSQQAQEELLDLVIEGYFVRRD